MMIIVTYRALNSIIVANKMLCIECLRRPICFFVTTDSLRCVEGIDRNTPIYMGKRRQKVHYNMQYITFKPI